MRGMNIKEECVMERTIFLGNEVRDSISGVVGIVTGEINYLYMGGQYQIAPKSVDGKSAESIWFEKARIELVGPGLYKS